MNTSNTTARPESPLLGRGKGEASYFTIQELTSSATALREGIDNRPTESAYHLLHVLVDQLLDPIREAWGEPIVVSSGYRCKELNALVGGAKNSHHMLGCAADITVPYVRKRNSLMPINRQPSQPTLIPRRPPNRRSTPKGAKVKGGR